MIGITFALVGILVTVWLAWRRKRFSYFKDLGIPGPEPSIMFGNYMELCEKNPIVCMKEWREKYGKIYGYYFGSAPMLVVHDTEVLKKVQISDFHKFINRPRIFEIGHRHQKNPGDGFSSQLVNRRDKSWKELRSTMSPSFTTSKMKTMVPIINDAIEGLMQNIEDNIQSSPDGFDMYNLYKALTMDVIGRTAFGIKTDCQRNPEDPFLKAMTIIFESKLNRPLFIVGFCFREFGFLIEIFIGLLRLWAIFRGNPIGELLKSVRLIIKSRRENASSKRQDLLQLLLDAEISDISKITANDLTIDDDTDKLKSSKVTSKTESRVVRHLSDNEIIDNSVLFFLAGYETTSTALAFTTHLLIHFPEVQERIREEVNELLDKEKKLDYSCIHQLQYLDQVMLESLRMYPPVYSFVNREAGEDIELDNFSIKKGTAVQVPIYTLQHDEEFWVDPEIFDPHRFSPENKSLNNQMAFQAFGAGPRNCIGIRFAQMEFKLALARILQKYKLVKCDKSDGHPVTFKIGIANLTPEKGVFVKAEPL